MRYIIAMALSIMLLAFAAAATGNGNTINVEICEEAEDNHIVGVTLAQVTGAVSDLFGNNNDVEQYQNLIANDNSLTGFGDDLSSVTQIGLLTVNATGSSNEAYQDILLEVEENCVTDGSISQLAGLAVDLIGCDNDALQETYADADENAVTMSDLIQMSSLDACAVGNQNWVTQFTNV
jgi:hypothetical protein